MLSQTDVLVFRYSIAPELVCYEASYFGRGLVSRFSPGLLTQSECDSLADRKAEACTRQLTSLLPTKSVQLGFAALLGL
jgi:hypothetical protein